MIPNLSPIFRVEGELGWRSNGVDKIKEPFNASGNGRIDAASVFANGYYDRLESLQGKNKTYYIGELPSFPTVETVAAYSRNLVETHFR